MNPYSYVTVNPYSSLKSKFLILPKIVILLYIINLLLFRSDDIFDFKGNVNIWKENVSSRHQNIHLSGPKRSK